MDPARRAVEMWRDRLAAAARNIADLNDSDAVRRLRARLASPDPFEGATLAEARRVASALDGLWADYLLLSRTVEEAAGLLRRPLFGADRGKEAAALLDGASIRLPAVSVPLRARGLLDAAERSDAVTPAAVLDAMERGFEAARRGAEAIRAAETAGRVKLDAMGAEPAAREPAPKARIEAARRALDRDPLGAAPLLGPLAASLAEARAAAEAAVRRRAALAGALDDARADLAALDAARARLHAARHAAAAVLLLPEEPAPGDLAAWLDRLASAAAEGQDEAAGIGLGRWSEACAGARRAIEADAAAVAAALREREDLRGRFRALRAKARALGAEERADPSSVAAALDAAPFDAKRARAGLAGYEAVLAAPRHDP